MAYIIKENSSGEYLIDFLLDKDFGYCCFGSLAEILAGTLKAHCFESSTDAELVINQIVKSANVENQNLHSYSVKDSASIEMPGLSEEIKIALEKLAAPRTFWTEKEASLYLVKTDVKNYRHHGLWDNTASHVIASNPNSGDQIDFVINGYKYECWTVDHNGAQITDACANLFPIVHDLRGQRVSIKILSHLGRSAALGEDGATDAFDSDVLGLYWLEQLNGRDWVYAPVSVEVLPPSNPWDYPVIKARWASCDNDRGWVLLETSDERLHLILCVDGVIKGEKILKGGIGND